MQKQLAEDRNYSIYVFLKNYLFHYCTRNTHFLFEKLFH